MPLAELGPCQFSLAGAARSPPYCAQQPFSDHDPLETEIIDAAATALPGMVPGGERGPRPHALSSGEVVYFEDLTVGQHWRRGPTRLSAERMIAFAREWDPQPFHLDPEAAARSRFGGLVASGAQTFAVAARLFTTTLGIAFAAGRGFDHVRLLRPLRPDVDVHLEVRVVRLKPGPHPDSGQADFGLKLVDASGHVILSGTAETLVLRGDGSPR